MLIEPKDIEATFAYQHDDPIRTVLRREFESYQMLLKKMAVTVRDLYTYVSGSTPLPIEIEKLWHRV